MEHFRVPRNQRFSLPPTMVVSGIRQFRPLHPWTWSLPYAIQIQILYTPLKVWNNGIRRKLLKYLNMWWSYFGNIPVNISQTSLRKMFCKNRKMTHHNYLLISLMKLTSFMLQTTKTLQSFRLLKHYCTTKEFLVC